MNSTILSNLPHIIFSLPFPAMFLKLRKLKKPMR